MGRALLPVDDTARAGSAGRGPLLGVDPGLRCTGYALLADADDAEARLIEAGAIKLDATQPLEQRLAVLQASIDELIETHRPRTLACEELYAHYRHPRTAILMAHARGIVLAEAARRGLGVIPVPSTQAKKLLTGSGHAGKKQVQRAIAATLGLAELPAPHDVADALAVALCGLRLRAVGREGAGP